MRRRWGARVSAVLALVIVVVALAQIFTEEPRPPSPGALAQSVNGEVGGLSLTVEPCRRDRRRDTWRCTVDATGSGLPIEYRVSMTAVRCWRAWRVAARSYGLPSSSEGCVDDVDALVSGLD
jgi:hypothetical protein